MCRIVSRLHNHWKHGLHSDNQQGCLPGQMVVMAIKNLTVNNVIHLAANYASPNVDTKKTNQQKWFKCLTSIKKNIILGTPITFLKVCSNQ